MESPSLQQQYSGEANLSLFRRGVWYQSLDLTSPWPFSPLRVCLAPELMIFDDVRAFRSRRREGAPVAFEKRLETLAEALSLFVDGDVHVGNSGMQSAHEFARLLGSHRGLPHTLVKRWSTLLREYVERAAERWSGNNHHEELRLVVLPSNTFTSLEACIDALVEGCAVWVRPSNREPFAAARFVACLVEAGWPASRLGLYPMSRQTLDAVVTYFDRVIIYGDDDVVRAFAGRPNVEIRGPGRARAFVNPGVRTDESANWLYERITSDSGRFCTNVKSIFCVGPPGGLSENLGELLDGLQPEANLAWWPDKHEANRVAAWLQTGLGLLDGFVTKRHPVHKLHGRTYLMPSLVSVGQPSTHRLIELELPFPYATISQISMADLPRFTGVSRYVYNLNIDSSLLPKPSITA